LLSFSAVLISLLPRVTGMKIENAWGRGSRGMVRCTARLSRPLRAKEWHRLEGLPGTTVQGNIEVVHECRPDEVEDWHALLSDVLRGEWVPPVRAVAQTAGPKARRKRPRPEPAA
jgi:hypothetical protein